VFLAKFARAWSWGILFSSKAQTSLRGCNTGIKMAVSNSPPILRPAYKAGFMTEKVELKVLSKGKWQFAQVAFLQVV
jgi:hypothetical protein|tara:strand:+ start:471 stop:701 length:231 start_codon:yes stop_codon:yes gene_type:complete